MSGITVVEDFTQGKLPDQSRSEDVSVVVERAGEVLFAAVVDGATDKSGMRYEGMTGGRYAAHTVARTLRGLDPRITAHAAVAQISASLAAAVHRVHPDTPDHSRPSANAVIFSARRREVWRVGDCHFAIVGEEVLESLGSMPIDEIASLTRAAHVHSLLIQGYTPEELAESDPGRALILPLLQNQGALANADPQVPFSYGVLDGRPVPTPFIEVHPTPSSPFELILASDGYVTLARTRTEAEDVLARSLAEDPLRIGLYASTKAMAPGASSFDDRTWLHLAIPSAESV